MSSPLDPRKAVTVGRVLTPHGVRGEIKVEPATDFPERFAPGSRLWLDGRPYVVERSRAQGASLIVKLLGVDSRNDAEVLRAKRLYAAEPFRIEAEGLYYVHDIIGLRVETESGEALGEVEEVLATGSNDVYVVRGERGELLLPALDDVVKRVDTESRRMIVEVPPGIEFQPAASRTRQRRPPRRPRRPSPPAG